MIFIIKVLYLWKYKIMSTKTREQILLTKLYECQDEMGVLLKEGKEDEHYKMLCELIKRLEISLCDKQELM